MAGLQLLIRSQSHVINCKCSQLLYKWKDCKCRIICKLPKESRYMLFGAVLGHDSLHVYYLFTP